MRPGMGGGMPPGMGGGMPPGMGGGMPPGMGGGMGGGLGGLPFMQGQTPAEEEITLSPLYVIAVVETKNAITPAMVNLIQAGRLQSLRVDTKWGTTHLQQSKAIEFTPLELANRSVPGLVKRFEAKNREVHNTKDGKAGADELLKLAEWCLNNGLLNDYVKVMDEVVQADPNHRIAVAYQKVQAELARPAAPNKDQADWKSKLGMETYKITEKEKGHYTLLHTFSSNEAPEVQSRLNRLEDAFRSFYYWWAMKLNEPKDMPVVPPQRLLAIVVAKEPEFSRMHQIFESATVVADGFCARRDNLLIFSASRRDQPYTDLRSLVEPHLLQGDGAQFLRGKGDPYLQTAMLMLKALEQDGEIAAVSHDGSRQLLAASGLLPRNVAVPHWIQFGVGSFFGTPKGSPWPTVGGANASLIENNNYLLSYQVWSKAKKLDEPKVALERVVTDHYFRMSKGDNDKLGLLKARTLSWALTFFLAQRKTDGLRRYYKELSKLPRDLEFDEPILLSCFARAFDLAEVNNPSKVNMAKLTQLANEWHDYMSLTPLPAEINVVLQKLHASQKNELKAQQGNNPQGAGANVFPGGNFPQPGPNPGVPQPGANPAGKGDMN